MGQLGALAKHFFFETLPSVLTGCFLLTALLLLVGGFYLDYSLPAAVNLFRLYLFLYFLVLPYALYLGADDTVAVLVYCVVTGLLVTLIKALNLSLHRALDHDKEPDLEPLDSPESKAPSWRATSTPTIDSVLASLPTDGSNFFRTTSTAANSASDLNAERCEWFGALHSDTRVKLCDELLSAARMHFFAQTDLSFGPRGDEYFLRMETEMTEVILRCTSPSRLSSNILSLRSHFTRQTDDGKRVIRALEQCMSEFTLRRMESVEQNRRQFNSTSTPSVAQVSLLNPAPAPVPELEESEPSVATDPVTEWANVDLGVGVGDTGLMLANDAQVELRRNQSSVDSESEVAPPVRPPPPSAPTTARFYRSHRSSREIRRQSNTNATASSSATATITAVTEGNDDTSTTTPIDFSEAQQAASSDALSTPLPVRSATPRWRMPFTLGFSRMQLQQVMDIDPNWTDILFEIMLAVGTSFCALRIARFYYDISLFFLFFSVAGCQFSLVKSPLPDSGVSQHVLTNRRASWSRSLYLISFSMVILILDDIAPSPSSSSLALYGMPLWSPSVVKVVISIFQTLVLLLPLLFLLGIMPLWSTLIFWALEQLDMHVFGGTALVSIRAGVFSMTRNAIALATLYGLAYWPMQLNSPGSSMRFAIFCGLVTVFGYLLATLPTDLTWVTGMVTAKHHAPLSVEQVGAGSLSHVFAEGSVVQLLQASLAGTVVNAKDNLYLQQCAQLRHNFFLDLAFSLIVFGIFALIQLSNAYLVLQPSLSIVLYSLVGLTGFVNHYLSVQFRKAHPFTWFAKPILKTEEFIEVGASDIRKEAAVMWFDKASRSLLTLERHVLLPLLFISELSHGAEDLRDLFGPSTAPFVISLVGLKALRQCYSNPTRVWVSVVFAALMFAFDFPYASLSFVLNYFFISILISKFWELVLKIQFYIVYVAPWNKAWGSMFHLLMQPLGIPHTMLLIIVAVVSSVLSAPFYPLMGSAVFLMSYVRPIRFWETASATKRIEDKDIRVGATLDKGAGARTNNLDGLFYEQLAQTLSDRLADDVSRGRLGAVVEGDTFILFDDRLVSVVQIIGIARNHLTFQLRGLEFKGTYCQQRELESLNHDLAAEGLGCLCCRKVNSPKSLLSVNAALMARFSTWELIHTHYVLDSYSISLNPATTIFSMYEHQMSLSQQYIKLIIYYAARNKSLRAWLALPAVQERLRNCGSDTDSVFRRRLDADYDKRQHGISLSSFYAHYGEWIRYCSSREQLLHPDTAVLDGDDGPSLSDRASPFAKFCYLLSLAGRRALYPTGDGARGSFLPCYCRLFRGDVRISHENDEWLLSDVDIVNACIKPAARMSLKIFQDVLAYVEDGTDMEGLWNNIQEYDCTVVICHETDPMWREAIERGERQLLTLRRNVEEDGTVEYNILMLNRRHRGFRVVQVNRESVRGLWAAQQQELVFFRNSNAERGSIQQMKAVLRNIINQSCDLPIGYPIFVSSIQTSFSTHPHGLESLISGMQKGFENLRFWMAGKQEQSARDQSSSEA